MLEYIILYYEGGCPISVEQLSKRNSAVTAGKGNGYTEPHFDQTSSIFVHTRYKIWDIVTPFWALLLML